MEEDAGIDWTTSAAVATRGTVGAIGVGVAIAAALAGLVAFADAVDAVALGAAAVLSMGAVLGTEAAATRARWYSEGPARCCGMVTDAGVIVVGI